jgi:regulator of replication initiation timing
MEKDIVKEGVALAEKEGREKQVQEVKRIVHRTLEKIADLDTRVKELQEERRILKMDLDDLKDGKLDRIEERQHKDDRARRVSVVIIERETIRENIVPVPYPVYPPVNPWRQPWTVTWNQTWVGDNCLSGASMGTGINGTMGTYNTAVIDCSVAKDAAVGSYNVSGSIVNFR